MKAADVSRTMPPGLLSGIAFFAVVLLGCGFIVVSKLSDVRPAYVTLVPVLIMVSYALLLGAARLFRLRDDQSGDNLYYMGFLFTLTSLGVSLYQFNTSAISAEAIVQNFGIAIASTIAGIALRIFFNQMRRDPVEVEHTARLELAEASRKVRRELESTVLEFAYFRRATQQSITDALDEMNSMLAEAKDKFVGQLTEFATNSSKPLEEASMRTGATIEEVNERVAGALETLARQVANDSAHLSQSTEAIIKAINTVVAKLTALQTPDHIIEIKLNPTIQGLSRAVNTFSKSVEDHARSADSNLQQTQKLSQEIMSLAAKLRADETARASSLVTPIRPPLPTTPPPTPGRLP
jgi:hypothetical protein